MKKTIPILIAISSFLVVSCNTNNSESNSAKTIIDSTSATKLQIVGGDKDKHGCKGSAGYTWSVIKNDCIRIFESGIKLDPQDKNLDQTLAAFIVFKSDDDDSKVELYYPSRIGSIILNKKGEEGAGVWTNDTLTLNHWKGMYSLENEKNKLLYQGHNN
jgi:hypothetical protein